jgi:hypothetical protein
MGIRITVSKYEISTIRSETQNHLEWLESILAIGNTHADSFTDESKRIHDLRKFVRKLDAAIAKQDRKQAAE